MGAGELLRGTSARDPMHSGMGCISEERPRTRKAKLLYQRETHPTGTSLVRVKEAFNRGRQPGMGSEWGSRRGSEIGAYGDGVHWGGFHYTTITLQQKGPQNGQLQEASLPNLLTSCSQKLGKGNPIRGECLWNGGRDD